VLLPQPQAADTPGIIIAYGLWHLP